MTETVDTILHFWFGSALSLEEINNEKAGLWWAKNPDIDQEVQQRFEWVVEQIEQGNRREWEQTPRGILALILATDQFPRNMYRESPGAFEYDSLAIHDTCFSDPDQLISHCVQTVENKIPAQ